MTEDKKYVELLWAEKYDNYDKGEKKPIEKPNLPFQTVKTINEPRMKEYEETFGKQFYPKSKYPENYPKDWKNLLIWGDNKLVMSSLIKQGWAGKINLIYIDPPFFTGADFTVRTRLGDERIEKEPSIIEERAYKDTWSGGIASYLRYMYERLVLMRDLLAENGSIYVHLDWHVGHYVKVMMDEIFGYENFKNEIARQTVFSHSDPKQFGRNHDLMLFYSKTPQYIWNTQYQPYDDSYIESAFRSIEPGTGRRYQLVSLTGAGSGPPKFFCGKLRYPPPGRHWAGTMGKSIEELEKEGRIVISKNNVPRVKYYLDELPGKVCQSIWTDVFDPQSQSEEKLYFDTQKPEALLKRIILASSNFGDIVADFFCGSGTTLAVAEKLGRRWIGSDLSKFAIQVTRKRLLDVHNSKDLSDEGKKNFKSAESSL